MSTSLAALIPASSPMAPASAERSAASRALQARLQYTYGAGGYVAPVGNRSTQGTDQQVLGSMQPAGLSDNHPFYGHMQVGL